MLRPAPDFFQSVQALRALAALFIVFGHAGLAVMNDDVRGWEWVALLGERGVQVFFVMSGFSIEWAQSRKAAHSIVDFTVRRFLRVMPTYWLATLALTLLFIRNGQTLSLWGNVIPSFLLVPHWSLQEPGSIYPLLVPGWTLFFEAFFYLLFALSLLLGERWRRKAVTAVLLGLVLLGSVAQPEQAIPRTYTHWMLAEFVIGIWLARGIRRWGLPPVWAVIGVPLGFGSMFVGHAFQQPVLELLGMFLWMAGMLASEGLKAWGWPALSWMGAGAFSIYIWHGLVLGSLFKRVVTPLGDLLSLGGMPRVLMLWALCVASTLVIFVLLDLPVMKWLSRQWAQRAGARIRYPAPTQ